jgi:hypothetical protein
MLAAEFLLGNVFFSEIFYLACYLALQQNSIILQEKAVMKKLIYTIAFGLTFLSVTSASRAIASAPTDPLTTGDSSVLWQINPVSQRVQPSNEPIVSSPAIQTTAPLSTTPISTVEPACKGDAARPKPPIPNNPTHIRNVVWRNVRAMCLYQIAQKTNSPQAAGQR